MEIILRQEKGIILWGEELSVPSEQHQFGWAGGCEDPITATNRIRNISQRNIEQSFGIEGMDMV